jgi:hypothetical protein
VFHEKPEPSEDSMSEDFTWFGFGLIVKLKKLKYGGTGEPMKTCSSTDIHVGVERILEPPIGHLNDM